MISSGILVITLTVELFTLYITWKLFKEFMAFKDDMDQYKKG